MAANANANGSDLLPFALLSTCQLSTVLNTVFAFEEEEVHARATD